MCQYIIVETVQTPIAQHAVEDENACNISKEQLEMKNGTGCDLRRENSDRDISRS